MPILATNQGVMLKQSLSRLDLGTVMGGHPERVHQDGRVHTIPYLCLNIKGSRDSQSWRIQPRKSGAKISISIEKAHKVISNGGYNMSHINCSIPSGSPEARY